MRELERENARWRAELADVRTKYEQERDLLAAYLLDDMPHNEEEFRRMVAESGSFSDLLRELEAEFGVEPRRSAAGGPFAVSYSHAVRGRLRRLLRRASASGILGQVTAALCKIERG